MAAPLQITRHNNKTAPPAILPKNLLYIVLALLVGLYSGINLSGIHHHQPHYDHNAGLTISGSNELESSSSSSAADGKERIQVELKQMETQLDLWKSKAATLEKEYAAAMNKIHTSEHDDGCERENHEEHENTRPIENPNLHPMCQSLLPYPTPSAMALWNQNILSVLEATRLPNDNRYKFHDFTTQVLQIITPRLHRSVKSMPHDWRSLERAMTVAWERYQYLHLLSKEERAKVATPPRPLKILVMGGSLLVGTNCRKLLSELGLSFRLPKRDCTWSNRLEQFLNSYAKNSDIVQVTKVAMGGTNTATGNVIWQYDLIPENARNPDIVLNAYSTNDMHILTILEAQSSNVTLRDKVFEMTQDFVRNVLHTCDPNRPPPLLLHADDYLGNEQRTIWDTTELSQGVQVLANYYGFASFSYADVVREIVYGDTHEAWLSANWWESGTYDREIHPGMGMHIASTWVIVYNLLNLVTTYCSIPPRPPPAGDYNNIYEYKAGYLRLPELRNDVIQAQNKPQSLPKGLPPILTKDLLIEDVSTLWKEDEGKKAPCDPEKLQGKQQHHVKCPFSWVSGLSLQQNNQTWIQEFFRNQATVWHGWNLGNDGGKLGFTPSTATGSSSNSTVMVLEFTFPQTIRSVTLFYMKSYGEKWRGSRLHFRVGKADDSPQVTEMLLHGVHDKETSEMYTEAMELPVPIPIGTRMRVEASLVGGTMFKIMGLAVCS